MKIPFLSFAAMNAEVRNELLSAFEVFLDSGSYILGEKLKEFEKEYAAFNKVKYCIGVSNGLDALQIALKTAGVGAGDEVIVPSNTYIASLMAISNAGAKPVLVEPYITTYNIDPSKIEPAITSKTKALMPVHLYGQACEMEKIMAIAARHNLFVVEDNAQSQGATYKGRLTGSWGDINGTSFYPAKNLGALGDAGAITTSNEDFARKAGVLRNYGSQKKYYNEAIGFNMRLDECQAAFLSVKLSRLSKWTEERQQIAGWYNEALKNNEYIILPVTGIDSSHVFHLYVIRTTRRDELKEYLYSGGVDTMIHYPVPPHLQEAYQHLGYRDGKFRIAEEIARTCLSLPLWPGMTKEMTDEIADKINRFFRA